MKATLSFLGQRAVILHRPGETTDRLVRQCVLLGFRAEARWQPLRADEDADIVLVDGNPLEDLKVLQDPAKISLVMKDGEIIKSCYDVKIPEGPIHVTGGNEPMRDEGVKKAMHAETH